MLGRSQRRWADPLQHICHRCCSPPSLPTIARPSLLFLEPPPRAGAARAGTHEGSSGTGTELPAKPTTSHPHLDHRQTGATSNPSAGLTRRDRGAGLIFYWAGAILHRFMPFEVKPGLSRHRCCFGTAPMASSHPWVHRETTNAPKATAGGGGWCSLATQAVKGYADSFERKRGMSWVSLTTNFPEVLLCRPLGQLWPVTAGCCAPAHVVRSTQGPRMVLLPVR